MKKIKFQFNKTEPSSKEINAMLDFDAVLKGAKVYKPWYKKTSWIVGGGMALLVLSTLLLSISTTSENSNSGVSSGKQQEVVAIPEQTISAENIPTEKKQSRIISEKEYSKKDLPLKSSVRPDYGPAFEKFTVNAQKGATITTRWKSVVQIPANLFRKKNGEAVKGDVRIYSREFRDALDIALSGKTMQYDTAGKHEHLQSAGMIEVWALQGKDTLEMAEGESMRIELASNNNSEDYNLYYLDPAKGWKHEGKDNIVRVVADADLLNADAKAKAEAERRKKESWSVTKGKNGDWVSRANNNIDPAIVDPVIPRKKDAKRFRFKLDVDPKENQELAVFNGMFFEVEKTDTNFTSAFYKIEWNNVEFSNNNQQYYYATFSKKLRLLDDFPNIAYDSKLYKEDRSYKRMIDNRQGDLMSGTFKVFPVFDKLDSVEVWKVYNKMLKDKKKAQAQRDSIMVQAYREQDERDTKSLAMNEQYKTNNKVFRAFNMMNFGVYNCDRVYRMAKRTQRDVHYTNSTGASLPGHTYASLIDKSANSVISYYGNTITYNPDNENAVLIVLPDGSISYVEPSRFKSFVAKPTQKELEVRKVENTFADSESMKKFIEGLK